MDLAPAGLLIPQCRTACHNAGQRLQHSDGSGSGKHSPWSSCLPLKQLTVYLRVVATVTNPPPSCLRGMKLRRSVQWGMASCS